MQTINLLVTHHSPDLDAITAIWLFKRFMSEQFANAKVAFVDAGSSLSEKDALKLGFELHQVTHVDTGLGRFDHHQSEKGKEFVSATSLVHEYLCQNQFELQSDDALNELVNFVTNIDHFQEINWPKPDALHYNFMIHELIRGLELTELHNDNSQLHFGMTCLDASYAILKQYLAAIKLIKERGIKFSLPFGECIQIETSNESVIKISQKQGVMLVINKDPKTGSIRIKARPDAPIDLAPVATKIAEIDKVGSWYYHPSGKMLINGSRKNSSQKASPLTIDEISKIVKQIYL